MLTLYDNEIWTSSSVIVVLSFFKHNFMVYFSCFRVFEEYSLNFISDYFNYALSDISYIVNIVMTIYGNIFCWIWISIKFSRKLIICAIILHKQIQRAKNRIRRWEDLQTFDCQELKIPNIRLEKGWVSISLILESRWLFSSA